MVRFFKLMAIFSVAFVLAGCSEGGGSPQPSPSPSESSGLGVGGAEGDLVVIQKASLGSEYLLQSSMAVQRGTGSVMMSPTSKGMKSRVVIFQEEGDKVVMLEANKGLVPNEDLPANALIATFPIKERKGDNITIDFNAGMTNVLTALDWYASDFNGKVISRSAVVSVASSYLRELKPEDGALTITQTLSVSSSSISGSINDSSIAGPALIPLEVTYYLKKYTENPNYSPVKSPGIEYLGYFEANPQVQEDFGDIFTCITRWDISKPVKYYISQSTPEKYRDAVRKGILYWNKAFGKEVVSVEAAPEGVTAPNFKHNIVQWQTTHAAGYAYADAQMDPRTGEILHAQVFLPSFTEAAHSYGIPKLDRSLEETEATPADGVLTDGEITGPHLCDMSLNGFFSKNYLYRDIVSSLPPERIDALTQDYLTWLVAHEVGHTMGLRHNFAASTVNKWSGEKEEEITRRYLKDGTLPGDVDYPMNSVMEYPTTSDLILSAAIFAKEGALALPYDSYAIQWGYFGFDTAPTYTGQPFCTDSQTGKYTDCSTRDSGGHLVERRAFATKEYFKKIPWLLSEVYLSAKAYFDPLMRKPVENVDISAKQLATAVAGQWLDLLELLTHKTSLLSIYRKHPGTMDTDQENINAETMNWLNAEIENAGGIKKIFEAIDPQIYKDTIGSFTDQFEKIITSDTFKTIPLYEGGNATFSEGELTHIRERARELFAEENDKLAYYLTSAINMSSFELIDGIEEVEMVLAGWAEYLLTESVQAFPPQPVPLVEGDISRSSSDQGSSVSAEGSVPFDFRYSFNTRKGAAQILVAAREWKGILSSSSSAPFLDWMETYSPSIVDKLRQRLEGIFGMPLGQVDFRSFPRKEQQRVRNEIALYYSLAGPAAVPINRSGSGQDTVQSPPMNGSVVWMQRLLK